jgi:hypothetical protein
LPSTSILDFAGSANDQTFLAFCQSRPSMESARVTGIGLEAEAETAVKSPAVGLPHLLEKSDSAD